MLRHPTTCGLRHRILVDRFAVEQHTSGPRALSRVANAYQVESLVFDLQIVFNKILLSPRIANDPNPFAVVVTVDNDVAPLKCLGFKPRCFTKQCLDLGSKSLLLRAYFIDRRIDLIRNRRVLW